MSGLPSGSLKGYDTVIQISQEAIQQQLIRLYETEVDNPVKGGSKFLIDHKMSLHTMLPEENKADGTTTYWTSQDGLDGFVECPTIDFTGKNVDPSGKFTTARVSFKFTTADKVLYEEDIPNPNDTKSYFTTLIPYMERGQKKEKPEKTDITGWTMSWEGLVAQKNIDSILNQIVGSAYVSNGARKKLSVNTSVFTASSIFCLFQSARVARSFELLDEKGVPVRNLAMKDALIGFLDRAFSADYADQTEQGQPTPKNPFVLGYTITQKRPSVEQASGVIKNDTPLYFLPRNVYMTISPGTSAHTIGALNFCMQTYREYGDSLVTVDPFSANHQGAGVFDNTFFQKTGVDAKPGVTDGILAFSTNVFYDNWILKDVAKQFNINYAKDVLDLIDDRWGDKTRNNKFWGICSTKDPVETTSGRKYTRDEKLQRRYRRRIDGIGGDGLQVGDGVDLKFKKAISYQSTLSDDPKIANEPDDVKRRIKLKVTAALDLTYEINWYLEAAPVESIFEGIKGVFKSGDLESGVRAGLEFSQSDERWSTLCNLSATAILGYEFEIGADPQDRGKFFISKPKILHTENGSLKQVSGSCPTTKIENGDVTGFTGYGLYKNKQWSSGVDALSKIIPTMKSQMNELETALDKFLVGVGSDFETKLTNIGKGLVDRLATTVIMPAGDVFKFKGLSLDSDGNVYTGIAYDTPTGGTVKMRDGETIGSRDWTKPKPMPTDAPPNAR